MTPHYQHISLTFQLFSSYFEITSTVNDSANTRSIISRVLEPVSPAQPFFHWHDRVLMQERWNIGREIGTQVQQKITKCQKMPLHSTLFPICTRFKTGQFRPGRNTHFSLDSNRGECQKSDFFIFFLLCSDFVLRGAESAPNVIHIFGPLGPRMMP